MVTKPKKYGSFKVCEGCPLKEGLEYLNKVSSIMLDPKVLSRVHEATLPLLDPLIQIIQEQVEQEIP